MNIPFLGRFGLSEREQRTASIGLYVLAAFVLVLLPLGLQTLVISRSATNDELRTALESIQTSRGIIQERKRERAKLEQRYGNPAPALAGFLAEAARGQKLDVSDSQDRQAVPHGKVFEERQTFVHLRKSGMLGIAKFLEKIETSGHPVEVSRLNVRKRSGEPDSYDVEVGVSAFDRKAPAKKAATPEGEGN